jgi:threonine dehydratase
MMVNQIIDCPEKPTLSSATAGSLEPGSITLPICQEVVDHTILVREDEIGDAMRLCHKKTGLKIEGSAGAAIAGWIKDKKRVGAKRKSCVVVCGGNIDDALW